MRQYCQLLLNKQLFHRRHLRIFINDVALSRVRLFYSELPINILPILILKNHKALILLPDNFILSAGRLSQGAGIFSGEELQCGDARSKQILHHDIILQYLARIHHHLLLDSNILFDEYSVLQFKN